MSETRAPEMAVTTHANCLRCGRRFVRHRRGHIYCSRRCRHRGAQRTGTIDVEAVERLFDPGRDPAEQVREDDWCPEHLDDGWRALYTVDTVATHRRWFRALEDSGQI